MIHEHLSRVLLRGVSLLCLGARISFGAGWARIGPSWSRSRLEPEPGRHREDASGVLR